MDYNLLRNLQLTNKVRMNLKTYTVVDIQNELDLIEFYLKEDKTQLEFMLQVPQKRDDDNSLVFYKVFRHGKEMKFVAVGFHKTIDIL